VEAAVSICILGIDGPVFLLHVYEPFLDCFLKLEDALIYILIKLGPWSFLFLFNFLLRFSILGSAYLRMDVHLDELDALVAIRAEDIQIERVRGKLDKR